MVLSNREKLSGRIEIDETLVGGKKSGKRGRGAEGKVLVAISVEVKEYETGRIRLSLISDASKKTLNPFIKEQVCENSTITTDRWIGYVDKKNGICT